MAIIEDEKVKKDLLNRLKTIKGHIGGIERMIEEDKDCADLLVQIAAIKSAVNKVGLSLIENNACQCLGESIADDDKVKDTVKEAVEKILKFSK